jgi:5-formyltetrahydrofolate cyclo-ligase
VIVVKSAKLPIAEKAVIRKEIMAKLLSLDRAERAIKSGKIKRRLFNKECFKRSESIMFYVSKSYEVDTTSMIEEALKQGKRIIIPVTKPKEKKLIPSEIKCPCKDLAKGAFGIREPKKACIRPVKLNDIGMVVVPGIAFDRQGNRIGHGQGYFDRFLRYLPEKTPTIGLAFKLQLVRRINTRPWDIPVTQLITA